MTTMVFANMTDPNVTPDSEFAYLNSALQNHGMLCWNCQLPDGCDPALTILQMQRSDDMYTLRFSDAVQYRGSDIGFSTLCRMQEMSFREMEEMKQFLRNMDLIPRSPERPHPVEEPHTAAAHGRPETDREKINTQPPTNKHIDQRRLARDMRQTIFGQDEAVEESSRWAATSAAKINPVRPVCLMLAGETGTGKNALARALCDGLNMQLTSEQGKYGGITVHCNEMTEDHMVARLTGAPAGYVGYGDNTVLSPVISNPYQIIVFDEIEKASPKVLDVLMGAMDTGEVTLNKPVDGRDSLDLRRSILIFTTNIPLDSPRVQSTMGFNMSAEEGGDAESKYIRKERYSDALVRAGMRREIVARFMSIIRFERVSSNAMIDIGLKAIQECAAQFGISISYVAPRIIQAICDRVGSMKYGVRTINSTVESALGLLFAGCSSVYKGKPFDILGTLESPELRVHTSEPPEPEMPESELPVSPMLPSCFPSWEHDAQGSDAL